MLYKGLLSLASMATLLVLALSSSQVAAQIDDGTWKILFTNNQVNQLTSIVLSTKSLKRTMTDRGTFHVTLPLGTDIDYSSKNAFRCHTPSRHITANIFLPPSPMTPSITLAPEVGYFFEIGSEVIITCDNLILSSSAASKSLSVISIAPDSQDDYDRYYVTNDLAKPYQMVSANMGACFTGAVNRVNASILFFLDTPQMLIYEGYVMEFTSNIKIKHSTEIECSHNNHDFLSTITSTKDGFIKSIRLEIPEAYTYTHNEFILFTCYNIDIPIAATESSVFSVAFYENNTTKYSFAEATLHVPAASKDHIPVSLGKREHAITFDGEPGTVGAYSVYFDELGIEMGVGESFIIPLYPGVTPEQVDQSSLCTVTAPDVILKTEYQDFQRSGFRSKKAIRAEIISGTISSPTCFSIICENMLIPDAASIPTFIYVSALNQNGEIKADTIIITSPAKTLLPMLGSQLSELSYSEGVGSLSSLIHVEASPVGSDLIERDWISFNIPKDTYIIDTVKCSCSALGSYSGCSQDFDTIIDSEQRNVKDDDRTYVVGIFVQFKTGTKIAASDTLSIYCTGLSVPSSAALPNQKFKIEASQADYTPLSRGELFLQPASSIPPIGTIYARVTFTMPVAQHGDIWVSLNPLMIQLNIDDFITFNVPRGTEIPVGDSFDAIQCIFDSNTKATRAFATPAKPDNPESREIVSVTAFAPRVFLSSSTLTIKCGSFRASYAAAEPQTLTVRAYRAAESADKTAEVIGAVEAKFSPAAPAELAIEGAGVRFTGVVGENGSFAIEIPKLPVRVFSGATFTVSLPDMTPMPSLDLIKCVSHDEVRGERQFIVSIDMGMENTPQSLRAHFSSGEMYRMGEPLSIICANLPLSYFTTMTQDALYSLKISFGKAIFADGAMPVLSGATPTKIEGTRLSFSKSISSFPSIFTIDVGKLGFHQFPGTRLSIDLPPGLNIPLMKDGTPNQISCVANNEATMAPVLSTTITSLPVDPTSPTSEFHLIMIHMLLGAKPDGTYHGPNDAVNYSCRGFVLRRTLFDVANPKAVVMLMNPYYPESAYSQGDITVLIPSSARIGSLHSALTLADAYAGSQKGHYMVASFYPLLVDINAHDTFTLTMPSDWIFPTDEKPNSICWASINKPYVLSNDGTVLAEIIGNADGVQTIKFTFVTDLPRLVYSFNNVITYTLRIFCDPITAPIVPSSYKDVNFQANFRSSVGLLYMGSNAVKAAAIPEVRVPPPSPVFKFSMERRIKKPLTDMELMLFRSVIARYLTVPLPRVVISSQRLESSEAAPTEFRLLVQITFLNSFDIEVAEAGVRVSALGTDIIRDFFASSVYDTDSHVSSITAYNSKVIPLTCYNGVKDEEEADIDCGGSNCPACISGQNCTESIQCQSNLCELQDFADYDVKTNSKVKTTAYKCQDIGNPSVAEKSELYQFFK